mgnify:CR=1 FL=1
MGRGTSEDDLEAQESDEVEVEEDDPFLMESFSCLTSLEYPYH